MNYYQSKWMCVVTLQRKFPYLLVEEGMLPDLNKEELSHHEGHTPSLASHEEEGTPY
jgi:hypothetical protein